LHHSDQLIFRNFNKYFNFPTARCGVRKKNCEKLVGQNEKSQEQFHWAPFFFVRFTKGLMMLTKKENVHLNKKKKAPNTSKIFLT